MLEENQVSFPGLHPKGISARGFASSPGANPVNRPSGRAPKALTWIIALVSPVPVFSSAARIDDLLSGLSRLVSI